MSNYTKYGQKPFSISLEDIPGYVMRYIAYSDYVLDKDIEEIQRDVLIYEKPVQEDEEEQKLHPKSLAEYNHITNEYYTAMWIEEKEENMFIFYEYLDKFKH